MAIKQLLALALLAVVGCQTLNPAAQNGGSDRLMSGSVSTVNGRVSRAFKDAGVSGGACAAWMDEKGEGVSVLGQTADGRKFRVILRQSGRDSTRAAVAWDGEPDDALGQKILAELAKE